MGAAFGGGSQTLFGASGADTLLSKLTTSAAICFMVTSVILAAHVRDASVTGSNLFKESAPSQSSPVKGQEAPAPVNPAPATGTAEKGAD